MQDTALVPAARPSSRRRWLAFAGHYLEMLVAMGVGMVALAPVWDGLWPGHADRPDTAARLHAARRPADIGRHGRRGELRDPPDRPAPRGARQSLAAGRRAHPLPQLDQHSRMAHARRIG